MDSHILLQEILSLTRSTTQLDERFKTLALNFEERISTLEQKLNQASLNTEQVRRTEAAEKDRVIKQLNAEKSALEARLKEATKEE